MRVLVVNAGSSGTKLSALADDDALVFATSVPPGAEQLESAFEAALASSGQIDAVGHRIVHGGAAFVAPAVINEHVRAQLERLTELAPLHQPRSLRALDLSCRLYPDAPAVACFDTAFHAGMPEAAATFALPQAWRRRWQLRRYGFHGLSHAYACKRVAALLGKQPSELRIVSCHLGAGASLAAVASGRSVDTTMGFTPLDGLVMATRSGSVDPGLLLWLERQAGLTPDELAQTLEQRSGLLGLAGSAEMETVLAAEADGDPDAALAIGVYLHRLRAGIAAMAAAMDGLDALVFTGGVGEHAAAIRERATDGLGFLGISVDALRNSTARADSELGAFDSKVRVLVIEAREDIEIAREVRAALAGGQAA